MDEGGNRKGWSEEEKLSLMLQIVAKAGKIPWDTIELPPGRTTKACQVMIDKEKSKIKKWLEANGDGSGEIETGKKDATKRKTGTKITKTRKCDNDNEECDPKDAKRSKSTKKATAKRQKTESLSEDEAIKLEPDGENDEDTFAS